MIRAFIAITPTNDVRAKIGDAVKNLRSKFPNVRWEDPNKLHLTLAFLGAVREEKVKLIKGALQTITQEHFTFQLKIDGLSYFYKKHQDSIIFLDVEDYGALRELYSTLKAKLKEIGLFLPRLTSHITMGRVKRMNFPHERKQILSQIIKEKIPSIGEFSVRSIHLYESLYSKKINTTQYRLLQSFPFRLDTHP